MFAGVQYIIDTLVDALHRDAARRFMFNEIGHFYRWWRQQSDARKAQVRALVNEGTCCLLEVLEDIPLCPVL